MFMKYENGKILKRKVDKYVPLKKVLKIKKMTLISKTLCYIGDSQLMLDIKLVLIQ
jgi:hypothetical protein